MNIERPSFHYLNFDLLIERADGSYFVRVTNSPAGEAVSQFYIPFSSLELENFLLKISRLRRGVRRLNSPEMEAAKTFGKRLFDTVFNSEIFGCLRSSLEHAESNGCTGLRLRLRLNTPELADLPWEFLYNSALNRFLVLAVETPLVRYIELPERVRPLAVKPPLKILVMLSGPADYPPLSVEEEWTKLQKALAYLQQRGLVTLERVGKATLPALQRRLRRGQYHIFHFIGHGGYDESAQDGVLLLEDETGHSRKISGQFLGTILHNHRSLRLAVLNACEGARASTTDPFTGTAQSLVQQGLPAVIAMQFEITDSAAITFSHEFYAALADGYPVDAALVEARTAIFASGNDVEWGTPVLYMRAPDGKIFAVARPLPPLLEAPKVEAQKAKPEPPPPPTRAKKNMPIAQSSGAKLRKWLATGIVITLATLIWQISLRFDWNETPGAAPLVDFSSLSITSAPPNVHVFLEGNAIGTTPIIDFRIRAGEFTVRAQKPNYIPLDTTLVISERSEAKLFFALNPEQAHVAFQVLPYDAVMVLDGESLSATKRQRMPLHLGTHNLHLSHQGYKPRQIQFEIASSNDTTFAYTLETIEIGTLRVLSLLSGSFYINDSLVSNIVSGDTCEYDQPTGSYKVEVRNKNIKAVQTVTVAPGKITTVTLEAKPVGPPVVITKRRLPTLRSSARSDLTEGEVKKMLAAKGLFDIMLNASGRGFANDFNLRTIRGTQVIVDNTAGLMWERNGSSQSMICTKAEQYIRDLNIESKHNGAGYTDWRLPTLEEALSLLERSQLNRDLYIDTKFARTQRNIWTIDKESADQAWVVSFGGGICSLEGVDYNFYVRAVRSLR